MGTVLSLSPRDKAPPYAMEYSNGSSMHQNHYNNGYQVHRGSRENILQHNNNPVVIQQTDKSNDKGLKKHMFLNALSWKRLTSSSSGQSQSKITSEKDNHFYNQIAHSGNPMSRSMVAQYTRQPLDNVHPSVENNKNIQVNM